MRLLAEIICFPASLTHLATHLQHCCLHRPCFHSSSPGKLRAEGESCSHHSPVTPTLIAPRSSAYPPFLLCQDACLLSLPAHNYPFSFLPLHPEGWAPACPFHLPDCISTAYLPWLQQCLCFSLLSLPQVVCWVLKPISHLKNTFHISLQRRFAISLRCVEKPLSSLCESDP